MLRDIKTQVFYPYPPERVWQAITNRRAMAVWLMENDFEPRIGHKFRFQLKSQQGLDATIYCEVIELDEPRILSYTWRSGLSEKPTIVTLTLIPIEGGTQLQLEHRGFESEVTVLSQSMGLAQTSLNSVMPQATLETRIQASADQVRSFQLRDGKVDNFDNITCDFYLTGDWHSALNRKLQNVLIETAEEDCFRSIAST